MKKFCNKISKQQWRITVPNINSSVLKKLPNKISDDIRSNSRNSGSYDLEAAQKEYDRSRSLPNSVYLNSDTSDSDTDDEKYEDARNSNVDTNPSEDDFLDTELYADVVITNKMEAINTDTQYTYDVPKISFSFFSKSEPKCDSEPEQKVLKSELHIQVDETPTIKSDSEILPVIGIIKCGSDPNLVMRDKTEDEDDGLYKIPRQLTRCRLSQSLNDFNVEEFQPYTSDHSSIEHVSASQVIAQSPPTAQNSDMDYCKVRSKLPMKLRRPTFLRKPKKAVDTWNTFRTKFNNIIVEHAAQQRVGAFNDKEKITINFEEVYKSSKNKCKNAFKSTTRIFKRNQDCDSENTSQIVKNDAFFARVPLTPNDIEYKFDFNNDKATTDSNKTIENDDEKVDSNFSSIKSAFRRSKIVMEVRTS